MYLLIAAFLLGLAVGVFVVMGLITYQKKRGMLIFELSPTAQSGLHHTDNDNVKPPKSADADNQKEKPLH